MSAHTPGPWSLVEHDSEGGVVEALDGLGFVEREVCHYFTDADDNGESEANALLIAAAPNLLSACKGAVAWTHDPSDAPAQFERIAEEFHRDTGFTRPGKDSAAAAHQDRDACDIAWQEWRVARSAKVLADLRAAIAKADGR